MTSLWLSLILLQPVKEVTASWGLRRINPLIYSSIPRLICNAQTHFKLQQRFCFLLSVPSLTFNPLLFFRLHHGGGLPEDVEAPEHLPKDANHRRGHLQPGRHHRQQPRRQHRHWRVHGGLPADGQEEPPGTRAQHVHGHDVRPDQAGGHPWRLNGGRAVIENGRLCGWRWSHSPHELLWWRTRRRRMLLSNSWVDQGGLCRGQRSWCLTVNNELRSDWQRKSRKTQEMQLTVLFVL